MKTSIFIRMFTGFLLAAACFNACSDALLDEMASQTETAFRPVESLPAGRQISAHETLRFVFPQSMKDIEVTYTGSLATIPGQGMQWSSTNRESDTLSLNTSGAVFWNIGPDLSLVFAMEIHGEKLSYSFQYSVIKALFVANPADTPSGNENGSITRPFKTIQAAIDAAKALYVDVDEGPVNVLVGAGNYKADCHFGNKIYVVNMEEGVSLYGGYAPGFGTRNPLTYISRIIDLDNNDNSGITHPVHAGENLSNATVLNGFEIQLGGTIGAHAGVYCDGSSPTLQNLVIQGPMNTPATENTAYGIYLENSSAIIESCNIDPGYVSDEDGESYGVSIKGASPVQVLNSEISGGRGNACYGIFISKGETDPVEEYALISGNTIDGGVWGSGDLSMGTVIWLADHANPEIIGNHFIRIKPSDQGMFGIVESSDNSDPVSVRNNNFDFPGIWYWDEMSTLINYDDADENMISTGDGTDYLLCEEWGNTGFSDQE